MPHFPPLPETGQDFDQFHNWLRAHTISAQQIITGSLQVGQEISSSNYVAGTSGWMIDGDGNAEFNDVIVRGDLYSSNWDGAVPASLSSFDPTASQGYYLDSSAGVVQFGQGVLVGTTASGGTIQAISGDVSLRLESNRAVPSSNPYILLESNSSPITILEMLATAYANIQLEASPAGTHMDLKGGNSNTQSQAYLAVDADTAQFFITTDTGSTTALFSVDIDPALPQIELMLTTGDPATQPTLAFTGSGDALAGQFSVTEDDGFFYVVGEDVSGFVPYFYSKSSGTALARAEAQLYTQYGTFAALVANTYATTGDTLHSLVAGVTQTQSQISVDDVFAVLANGTEVLAMNDAQIVSKKHNLGVDGTTAAPTYSFANDPDTGWYTHGSGGISFVGNAQQRWRFTASDFDTQLGTGGPSITGSQVGDATTAAFTFGGDQNTGMFRQGADSLGFTAGGTERGRFTSAGIFFTTPNTSASAADLRSGSSALTNIVRSTSSRKYKRDFRKLDTPWGVLSKLNPVRFWSIPDERDMVGFVAEEVGDVIPDARDNENYDHRAVLAYAVAGLVDAERRITQLEDIVLKGEPYAKVP